MKDLIGIILAVVVATEVVWVVYLVVMARRWSREYEQ
jgi:hypothetical protein